MKAHILLLEDNQLNVEQFVEMLEAEGYEVHHAFNGGEAMKIIQDKKIPLSLALLDLEIATPGDVEQVHLGEATPMKRGAAVAKKLIEERGAIPIIFASAFGEHAKKIVTEANFTSPHVFYHKETIFRDQEVITNSIRLAIEKIDEQEVSSPTGNIFNHRHSGTLTIRTRNDQYQGDREANRNMFRIIRKSELAYILRDSDRGIGFHLLDKTVHYIGDVGPTAFDEQYQAMIDATDEEDFLMRGKSERMAFWANTQAIRSWDGNNLFFTNGEIVVVGESIRTALREAFPHFRT